VSTREHTGMDAPPAREDRPDRPAACDEQLIFII